MSEEKLEIEWIRLHADKGGTITDWLTAVLRHAHHINQGNPCCEQDSQSRNKLGNNHANNSSDKDPK